MHWRDYHALCNTIDVIKEELQEKEEVKNMEQKNPVVEVTNVVND